MIWGLLKGSGAARNFALIISALYIAGMFFYLPQSPHDPFFWLGSYLICFALYSIWVLTNKRNAVFFKTNAKSLSLNERLKWLAILPAGIVPFLWLWGCFFDYHHGAAWCDFPLNYSFAVAFFWHLSLIFWQREKLFFSLYAIANLGATLGFMLLNSEF